MKLNIPCAAKLNKRLETLIYRLLMKKLYCLLLIQQSYRGNFFAKKLFRLTL